MESNMKTAHKNAKRVTQLEEQLDALRAASLRAWRKFGHNEEVPLDWSERTDLKRGCDRTDTLIGSPKSATIQTPK